MKKIIFIFLVAILCISMIYGDTLEIKNKIYKIKKGDCLWNISKEFYSNPFLWPKIWDANPYIQNPDLIFPEDELVLPDISAESMEVEKEMAISPKKVEEEPIKTTKEKDVVSEEKTTVVEEEEEETEEIEEVIKDVQIPITYDNLVLSSGGVIQEDEITEEGYISGFEEKIKEFHGALEITFLSFYNPDVVIGSNYLIYNITDKIKDPDTHSLLGKKLVVKGVLTVIEINEDTIKAEIKKAFCRIVKGDKLTTYDPSDWQYIPEGGDPEVKTGAIASAKGIAKFLGAEQDIIFINLGKENGVKPGQEFYISKKAGKTKDPIGGTIVTNEKEIGLIRVLKVFNYSASAIVLKRSEMLRVGDPVTYKEQW